MRQLFVSLVAIALFALLPRVASAEAPRAATAAKSATVANAAGAKKTAKPKKTAKATSAKPKKKSAAKAPAKSAKLKKPTKRADPDEPLRLAVKNAPDAYYYRPTVGGQRPIIMYLHGRGGNPAADCRKWARVGRRFGWVVCPAASATNERGRTWSTGTGDARRIINATVDALREKHGRRVQLWGNVLVGFSEGAWVAMNVGLLDQRTWNRWLILAASDAYWGDISEALERNKRKIKRVYLLTGERDGVAQKTVRVGEALKKMKVPVRVKLVPGMGHEVPDDKMISTYRAPLAWLVAIP